MLKVEFTLKVFVLLYCIGSFSFCFVSVFLFFGSLIVACEICATLGNTWPAMGG